ncbi:hypothetical protein LPU83_pLPU83c_0557 (plasmid) [Rhizobium favelukesii]|uniref:Uncharacterized protein n=1 Tax=Rhizobium favelukesii TaxID=348824 RepID=W6RJU3_9HYPH|nr:hypothetical protein LPU83_pLPU83c_0557 [Rhizobium favelukesii]
MSGILAAGIRDPSVGIILVRLHPSGPEALGFFNALKTFLLDDFLHDPLCFFGSFDAFLLEHWNPRRQCAPNS